MLGYTEPVYKTQDYFQCLMFLTFNPCKWMYSQIKYTIYLLSVFYIEYKIEDRWQQIVK